MSQPISVKSFKDLNIEPVETAGTGFVGDKISVPKIIGKPITVFFYKIKDSKWPDKGNGKCLWIQIELNNSKRVIFTSSVGLQETIQKVPESAFPFTTTIMMQENDSYQFT